LVLNALFSGSLNDRPAVRSESVDDTTRVEVDSVEALVCASDHHFVHYNLFGSQHDAVLALYTDYGAGSFNSLLGVLNLEKSSFGRQRGTFVIKLEKEN